MESTETDLHQPMRGEITRANLYDVERTEDQVLNGFFKCEDSNLVESEAEKASFLWSDVFIDSYLAEFKRKPAKFCSGRINIPIYCSIILKDCIICKK